jgi:peptide/nickel transport system permease protein
VAVLAEATISFLGLGIPPPFPTWGQMLGRQARILGVEHEYLVLVPGLAIFIAVYAFNMLGDALRDVLDPRLRGSR